MQTHSFISEIARADNRSILPLIETLIQKDCFIRSIDNIDHITHIIALDEELLLLKIDSESDGDWLADEECYGDEVPLYFSEKTHKDSPLYSITEAIRFVSFINMTRKNNQQSHFQKIHALYLTGCHLINAEDMTEIWKDMNTSVFYDLNNLKELHLPNKDNGHDAAQAILERLKSASTIQMDCYLYDTFNYNNTRDDDFIEDFRLPFEEELDESEDDEPGNEDSDTTNDFLSEDFPFLPFEDEEEENLIETAIHTEENGENVMEEINGMTGLAEVKAKIRDFKNLTLFNRKLENLGCPIHKISTHAIFKGNPGTGKTTVAKKWGALLKQLGYLSKGHVVYCDRSLFIGKHYGDEEKRTREALEKAAGGVLFIDEAYTLAPKDTRDPGIHVLETLLNVLADEKQRDICIILAGYEEPMNELITSNPGIKSRFPQQNIFHFEDFSPEELMQIATTRLEQKRYTLSAPAMQKLRYMLEEICAQKDASYGNARFVCNCLESIYLKHATRCIEENDEDLFTIQEKDIPEMEQPKKNNGRRIGFK
ncbi:MAG: AAA family ATPase [Bacteroidaceae bacterium]|nr:AAA family ATPase [Bacteroidaceae bacterium]